MRGGRAFGASHAIELFNGVRLTPWGAPSCVRFCLGVARSADTCLVSYCRAGAVSASIDGCRPSLFRAGDVLVVPCVENVALWAESVERARGVAITVAPEAIEAAGGRTIFGLDVAAFTAGAERLSLPAVLHTDGAPSRACFDLETMQANDEPEGLVRLKALELFLIMQGVVAEGRHCADAHTCAAQRHKRIARAAADVLKQDASRTLTIAELAQEVGVSPTVLKEAFKTTFGVPVYAWYRDFRMQRACEMLVDRPQSSIGEIAADLGYANPSKFSKAFSECVGVTPRAWRSAQSRPSDS